MRMAEFLIRHAASRDGVSCHTDSPRGCPTSRRSTRRQRPMGVAFDPLVQLWRERDNLATPRAANSPRRNSLIRESADWGGVERPSQCGGACSLRQACFSGRETHASPKREAWHPKPDTDHATPPLLALRETPLRGRLGGIRTPWVICIIDGCRTIRRRSWMLGRGSLRSLESVSWKHYRPRAGPQDSKIRPALESEFSFSHVRRRGFETRQIRKCDPKIVLACLWKASRI